MPATQVERPFRLKTNLGEDALLLAGFHGYERVSTPFRFVLQLLSPDPNIDMKALLTQPVVLSINLDQGTERCIRGHVSRIKLQQFGDDGMASYEAEIVPWLWFLENYSGCRIFQRKTIPEILEKVFRDRGYSGFEFALKGSYAAREYCVQYRETDFNFVSRLMEDEGLFYFFRQTPDKHVLVIADHNSAFKPCPFQKQASYLAALGSNQPRDTVVTMEAEYRTHTGRIALTDYNFEKPHTNLYAALAGVDFSTEAYDYPGKYGERDEGDRYARIRLEEREAALVTVRGESNCDGFECGYAFELTDHYRDDANRQYALIALEHTATNTSYQAGKEEPYHYANRFEAIPLPVPFRPPRGARKPVIPGTQTALVVGPSGEEIYTDEYGRVKVQFHWDREGAHNEDSSCWIRVAQTWAGKNWGAIQIPRIGHEVVVSFLEGDPDRPLVTGAVYNADHTVPYQLPGEQTKSALKSRSSKGGGGFNEIRFEDKKDAEQVFIHAQKDMDLRVGNDRREHIGNDRNLIVAHDKLESVNRDEHAHVKRDRIEQIGRDHHLEIAGKEAIKVAGCQSVQVEGDVVEEYRGHLACQVTRNISASGMQVVIEGSVGLTLKVGGNFITIDPSGIAIKGTLVQINSAGVALPGTPGSLVPTIAPLDPADADTAEPGGANQRAGGTQDAAASNAPTHDPNAEQNQEKTHWIEIELVGDDGEPVPGERYRITLPDGTTVADGTLDQRGFARVDHIDPGTCKVTFPELDKEAWEPE